MTALADRTPMSDDDLESIVAAEISAALGGDATELANQRSMAMDYYQGRPFGNEIEGRSSVVSTDVRDTVEWIMPTLMRIFASGDKIVEFEPETPKDGPFASQATEYGNFIWARDNPGFLNTYTLFKDALLQKNGVGKVWWDDSKVTKRERYYGLDDEAYTALVNDDDVEIAEHTETQAHVMVPPTAPDQPPQSQEITLHDVVVTRLKDGGKVCIVPVVPEYFIISNDGRNIKDARFVGDRVKTTISELRASGIPEEKISEIIGASEQSDTSQEEVSRNTVEVNLDGSGPAVNPAMQTVWKIEGYIKADVDGDGIAEMRKVTVAGPGYTMIENEAWDDERPYFGVTPIIMPHRFWGLSFAELVTDIQLIRSTLWRQYLDNAYINNNQRMEVVAKNIIDPDELLSSRPGGYVRVKERESITPIVTPQIGEAMLAGLQYVDQVRENRTGVSERTQGLGTDPLHETMGGEQMLMTAAMSKIELVARVFAVGLEDAFRLILGLIIRYQKQPRMIQLTGKWVPMDPRSWNADMHVTASVGMTTGDNQQKMQHAMMLAQAQQAAGASGMLQITPDNAMATADLLVSSMGLKSADRFFTKPDPNQPPRPDPAMAKVQADAQVGQAKVQSQAQLQQQKAQSDAQLQQQKIATDAQATQAKAQAQAQVDHLHNMMEAQREQAKAQNDLIMQRFEAGLKTALELQLAHIKGAVAIEVARIGAKVDSGDAAYAKEAAQE